MHRPKPLSSAGRTATIDTGTRCAHSACGCKPAEGQLYCSDACRLDSGKTFGPCGCGHAACHADDRCWR
jgi:hypothetical protein